MWNKTEINLEDTLDYGELNVLLAKQVSELEAQVAELKRELSKYLQK